MIAEILTAAMIAGAGGSAATASESDVPAGCSVRETKAKCLPKVIFQDDSEWCSLHAVHAMVSQHVCLDGESREISFRAIVQKWAMQPGKSGIGYPSVPYKWRGEGSTSATSDVMAAIRDSETLASEECAPASEFYRWQRSFARDRDDDFTPIEVLTAAYQQYHLDRRRLGLSQEAARCRMAEVVSVSKSSADMTRFIGDITSAALSEIRDERRFLSQVFVPARCSRGAVKVRPFDIVAKEARSAKEISDTIDEVVKEGRLLNVSYCEKSARSNCDGHAVVIGGKRQVCCGQNCREDLLILNSNAKTESGVDWIPADRVKGLVGQYQALNREVNEKYARDLSRIREELKALDNRSFTDSAYGMYPDLDRGTLLEREDLLQRAQRLERSLKARATFRWIRNGELRRSIHEM